MKFSIDAQIEEVDREIAMRKDVYPRWVASRKMREAVADMHLARMEAVAVTLRWLKENEASIRNKVDAKPITPEPEGSLPKEAP